MALFGLADKDLPLLTHVAQLDPKNEDELCRFWLRYSIHFLADIKDIGAEKREQVKALALETLSDRSAYRKNMAVLLDRLEERLNKVDDTDVLDGFVQQIAAMDETLKDAVIDYLLFRRENSCKTYRQANLEDFAKLVFLAQKVMKDITEKQAVSTSDMRKLLRWNSRFPWGLDFSKLQSAFVSTDQQELAQAGYISIEAIHFGFSSAENADEMNVRLLNAIKDLLEEDYQRLSRCEECSYPFLWKSPNRSQRFCSHRCADRFGARRRRKNFFLSEATSH